MIHPWRLLWDWNNLESVRSVHSRLEACALMSFAFLVIFDVLAHMSEDAHYARAKRFEKIGLLCFGAAVLGEVLAYPFSGRTDALSTMRDAEQRARISVLDNSTQGLRTDAENARRVAEGFRAQIADSNARAKVAEAQALEARLALEQFKADRTLSNEQRQRIIAKLKPFAGQDFSFSVYPNPEALRLLGILNAVLTASGWKRIDPQIGDVNVSAAGAVAGMAYDTGIDVLAAPRKYIGAIGLADSRQCAFRRRIAVSTTSSRTAVGQDSPSDRDQCWSQTVKRDERRVEHSSGCHVLA